MKETLKKEIAKLEARIDLMIKSGYSDSLMVENWDNTVRELKEQLNALNEADALIKAIKKTK